MDLKRDHDGEPRHWTWVFRALWSCAPRAEKEGHLPVATKSNPICCLELRVPDTVLFEDGEPRKWLGCSPSGIIVRKPFLSNDMSLDSLSMARNNIRLPPHVSPVAPSSSSIRASGRNQRFPNRRMKESEVTSRMNTILGTFVHLVKPSSPEAPVCVAWYNDGSKEALSERSLQRLGGYDNWRASLCGLQVYIDPAHKGFGTFRGKMLPKSPATRENLRSSERRTEDNRGRHTDRVSELDADAADVAFAVEMSYAWREPRYSRGVAIWPCKEKLEERDIDFPSARSAGPESMRRVVVIRRGENLPPWPKSRIRVCRLQAEFIIDSKGLAWFTHASQAFIQVMPRTSRRERIKEQREISLKRAREEASLDASVALRELRAMISLAKARGLDAEEVLAHFDTTGSGRVGHLELSRGMGRLGIPLSEEASVLVIQTIASRSERHDEVPRITEADREHRSSTRGIVHGKNLLPRSKRPRCHQAGRRSRFRSPTNRRRECLMAADLWCLANSKDKSDYGSTRRRMNDGPDSDVGLTCRQVERGSGQGWEESASPRRGAIRSAGGGGRDCMPPAMQGCVRDETCRQEVRGARNKLHAKDKRGGVAGSVANSGQCRSSAGGRRGDGSTAGQASSLAGNLPTPKSESGKRKFDRDPCHRVAGPAHAADTASGMITSTGEMALASFPCADPAAEAALGRDHVFHVERGLVIAYRILESASSGTSVFSSSNLPCFPGTKKDGPAAGRQPHAEPLLMVVAPGLFQTLDTVETALRPLLSSHPCLVVLIVAPPGLPNTHWPARAALNGELVGQRRRNRVVDASDPPASRSASLPLDKLAARCVSRLLEHLLGEGGSLAPREELRRAPERSTSFVKVPSTTDSRTEGVSTSEPPSPTERGPTMEPPLRPSSPQALPVVFVGFGTGANVMLRLVSTELSPVDETTNIETDIVRSREVDGSRNKAGGGSRLSKELARRGAHVGGLVLVNGFVSLDECSHEILRTLRGAFCDQSNGRTRVEALTSLLLSEHHLRAAGRDMAVVSREFLSTRGALYLDADATAAGTWMDQRKAQKQSLLPSRREEVGLTVGYVLREIDRANRSEYRRKLRRTSRRWRQRHGEADGEVMSEGCREELSDDSTDHAHENGDEGQGSGTESKRSVWGDPDREGEGTGDLIARLALAAVVSTIDGLLNSNTGVDGQTYRREGVRSPPTGGGEPSGQEANPEAAMLEGVRRAGLPLLMVQSSEDALIGTPLPVILRDEIPPSELLSAEASTVSECIKPLPHAVEESSDAVDNRNTDGTGSQRGPRVSTSFRVHVCWVKAGHDVLQERTAFLLSLLDKVACACHGREVPPGGPSHLSFSMGSDGTALHDGDDESSPSLDIKPSTDSMETDRGRNVLPKPDASSREQSRRSSKDEGIDIYGDESAPDRSVPDASTPDRSAPDGSAPAGSDPERSTSDGSALVVPKPEGSKPDESILDGCAVQEAPQGVQPWSGEGLRNEGPTPCCRASESTSQLARRVQFTRVTITPVTPRAPKLLDLHDARDPESLDQMRRIRELLESFLKSDLQVSVLENGLSRAKEQMASLDVPGIARYTFQTMKDCWTWRAMAVEATRAELDISGRLRGVRKELASTVKTVNAMRRVLRKGAGEAGGGRDNGVGDDLRLAPEEERALREELSVAEGRRESCWRECELLQRRHALLRSRADGLNKTLLDSTEKASDASRALERVMGQLRSQLSLLRIQQRVFHEELLQSERSGLRYRSRLARVEGKLKLVGRHPAEWVDSDAWQSGYIQRIETVELLDLLKAERRRLKSRVEKARLEHERARKVHSAVDRERAQVAAKMEGMATVYSLLTGALSDEDFRGSIRDAAIDQQTAENNLLTPPGGTKPGSETKAVRSLGSGQMRRRPEAPVAARVRRTHHRNRTANEKRWVALDAVVNPELYNHINQEEAEEMRWDALYYTRFERDDILRILGLPAQPQLALPFLHSPHELAAHELLGRYTHGIKPNHFMQLDQKSQDACATGSAVRLPAMDPSTLAKSRDIVAGWTSPLVGSRGGDEDGGVGNDVSRRVLERMRDRASAQVKTSDERDDEEVIWLELDRRLRPQLYDQNEDPENSGEAKEDSGINGEFLEICEQTVVPSLTRGDVGEPPKGDSAARRREAIAARIACAISASDLERLAEEVLGGAQGRRSGHIPDGGELASVSVDVWHEGSRHSDIKTEGSLPGQEKIDPRDISGEKVGSCNGASRLDIGRSGISDSETSVDLFDLEEAATEKEAISGGGKQRLSVRVQQIVRLALSRFMVREEETPIGRAMTRSLAMFQEAALQLISGERDVLRDLSQHTAMVALLRGESDTGVAEETERIACGGIGSGEVGHEPKPGTASGFGRGQGPNGVEQLRDTNWQPQRVPQVYGSWEVVHPASLGLESQEVLFHTENKEGSAANLVHPASFWVDNRRCGSGRTDRSSQLSMSTGSAGKMLALDEDSAFPAHPLDILAGNGRSAGWLAWSAESNLVASSMEKVGEFDPSEVRRRGLLVASRTRECLLDVKDCEMQASESIGHGFRIRPHKTTDCDSQRLEPGRENTGSGAKVN